MLGLVMKRHPAPGWIVLSELANSTGGNVRGFADAFAIGIWPSHRYEAHLYEFKISREDIKKELADPSKGDTVGKFADYRWLVISEEKLIETLVIPEGWGILTPKGSGDASVLRVVRKAPKQEAVPWTRGFIAAITRHVSDKHVTKAEYEKAKETAHAEVRKQVEREANWEYAQLKRAHDELLGMVNEFQKNSGIDIRRAHWQLGDIGEAVRLVVAARQDSRYRSNFLHIAEGHEQMAKTAREVAKALSPEGVEAPSDVPETTTG